MGLIHTEFRKMIDKSTAYGSSEDVKEEVRSHTVVGGRDTDYRRAEQSDPRCEHIMEAQKRIVQTNDGRRLCLSSKGRSEWEPKKGREGDLIAVAAGSQIPIVLRSRRVEEYEVVGAC